MGDAISATPAVAAALPPADPATRLKIKQTAENFEAAFLSVMMQSMWQGVGEGGAFSGGKSEQMFRSVLTESMAKQVARAGGIGLSTTVEREMLKLQGLSA